MSDRFSESNEEFVIVNGKRVVHDAYLCMIAESLAFTPSFSNEETTRPQDELNYPTKPNNYVFNPRKYETAMAILWPLVRVDAHFTQDNKLILTPEFDVEEAKNYLIPKLPDSYPNSQKITFAENIIAQWHPRELGPHHPYSFYLLSFLAKPEARPYIVNAVHSWLGDETTALVHRKNNTNIGTTDDVWLLKEIGTADIPLEHLVYGVMTATDSTTLDPAELRKALDEQDVMLSIYSE